MRAKRSRMVVTQTKKYCTTALWLIELCFCIKFQEMLMCFARTNFLGKCGSICPRKRPIFVSPTLKFRIFVLCMFWIYFLSIFGALRRETFLFVIPNKKQFLNSFFFFNESIQAQIKQNKKPRIIYKISNWFSWQCCCFVVCARHRPIAIHCNWLNVFRLTESKRRLKKRSYLSTHSVQKKEGKQHT